MKYIYSQLRAITVTPRLSDSWSYFAHSKWRYIVYACLCANVFYRHQSLEYSIFSYKARGFCRLFLTRHFMLYSCVCVFFFF